MSNHRSPEYPMGIAPWLLSPPAKLPGLERDHKAEREAMLAARRKTLLPDRREPTTTRKRDRPACGAKTRKGTPCAAKAVWDKQTNLPRNGKCRLHGGLSTGANTPEGLEKLREVGRASWLSGNPARGPGGRFVARGETDDQTARLELLRTRRSRAMPNPPEV